MEQGKQERNPVKWDVLHSIGFRNKWSFCRDISKVLMNLDSLGLAPTLLILAALGHSPVPVRLLQCGRKVL